jgi:beta-barrel assembly-enhancing protease
MRARKFSCWLLVVLLLAQAACAGLGGRGWAEGNLPRFNTGFNLFSPEQDIELGAASAEELKRQITVLRDEPTTAYVQGLGEKIAAVAPGYRFKYKFIVVASEEINAFALPGGYVFVNTGAVEAARNEGELAGVLAHEIAHVELRHGTTHASKTYLAKLGLSALDALTGGKDSNLGQLTGMFVCAAANAFSLRSNRAAELQADLEGARLMTAAGYDPRDMAGFFETLNERSDAGASSAQNDHPDTMRRVASISSVAATLEVAPAAVRDTAEFRWIKSRLKGRR